MHKNGKIRAINIVDIEDYIKGVVPKIDKTQNIENQIKAAQEKIGNLEEKISNLE